MAVMGVGAPHGAFIQDFLYGCTDGMDVLVVSCLVADWPEHGPVRMCVHQFYQAGNGTGRDFGVAVEQDQEIRGRFSDTGIIAAAVAAITIFQN